MILVQSFIHNIQLFWSSHLLSLCINSTNNRSCRCHSSVETNTSKGQICLQLSFISSFRLRREFLSCTRPTLRLLVPRMRPANKLTNLIFNSTLNGSQTLIDSQHFLFHLLRLCRLLPLARCSSVTDSVLFYFFHDWEPFLVSLYTAERAHAHEHADNWNTAWRRYWGDERSFSEGGGGMFQGPGVMEWKELHQYSARVKCFCWNLNLSPTMQRPSPLFLVCRKCMWIYFFCKDTFLLNSFFKGHIIVWPHVQ